MAGARLKLALDAYADLFENDLDAAAEALDDARALSIVSIPRPLGEPSEASVAALPRK